MGRSSRAKRGNCYTPAAGWGGRKSTSGFRLLYELTLQCAVFLLLLTSFSENPNKEKAEPYGTWTLPDLRAELRRIKARISGTKPDLTANTIRFPLD